MLALQLVVREGCHLCDAFEEELQGYPHYHQLRIERIVINRQPELEEQFGDKVPVLLNSQQIVCHYFLDVEKLDRLLSVSGYSAR